MAWLFALLFVISNAGAGDPTCSPQVLAEGKPTYRMPARTPEVLRRQVGYGHITQAQVEDPDLVGYVGLFDCGRLGQQVGVTWPDGVEEWPLLVVDCRDPRLPPYPDDLDWVLAAEFDRAHWHDRYDWGQFARREPIEVWTLPPGCGRIP